MRYFEAIANFQAIASLNHLGKVVHQHGVLGSLPLDYHAILELQAMVGVASGCAEGEAPPHHPPSGQWWPRTRDKIVIEHFPQARRKFIENNQSHSSPPDGQTCPRCRIIFVPTMMRLNVVIIMTSQDKPYMFMGLKEQVVTYLRLVQYIIQRDIRKSTLSNSLFLKNKQSKGQTK